MDNELALLAERLREAKTPEDFFGPLVGSSEEILKSAKRLYKRLARLSHPDHHMNGDREAAEEAFKNLQSLWERAEKRIKDGKYGQPYPSIVVKTKRREYKVGAKIASGDLANLYRATFEEAGSETEAVFKVARDPRNNDLLANEAKALRRFASPDCQYPHLRPYVPTLGDSFTFRDDAWVSRQTNIFGYQPNLFSLKEVFDRYPTGLDPRDMAWMWRRLLVALGFAHQNGVIHGAILPTHVLIEPNQHGLVVVDWSYSVLDPETSGGRIKAINLSYESWYPAEVADKQVPLPGLDIYMGAKCMVYLLGGDPIEMTFPPSVPRALRAFFKGCVPPGPKQRPQDAWELLEEFDDLLERLYGKRRFRPFSMK